MNTWTTYLVNNVLLHVLGIEAFASPTTFIGLFVINPTMPDGTGGVETTYAGYYRVPLAGLFPTTLGTSGIIANSSTITFGLCTDSGATIVGVGIWDSAVSGNLLMAGACAGVVSLGVSPTFETSSLVVSDN